MCFFCVKCIISFFRNFKNLELSCINMFGISEHAPAVTAEPLFSIRTISRNCPVIEPNASSDHNNNYRSCWIMIIVGLCAQCVIWWLTGERDSLKITSVHQRWWAQKLFVSFALQIGHLWVCVWVVEVLEFAAGQSKQAGKYLLTR